MRAALIVGLLAGQALTEGPENVLPYKIMNGDTLVPDLSHASLPKNIALDSDLADGTPMPQDNVTSSRHAKTAGTLSALRQTYLPYWHQGVVPYMFAQGVPPQTRDDFIKATQVWSKFTCLTFRPKNDNDVSFIRVNPADGVCNSFVGRVFHTSFGFDINDVNLATACDFSAVLHEIGHAVGLNHEHSRPDRSKYSAFLTGIATNDQATNMDESGLLVGNYDLASIMHYEPTAFQTAARQVIVLPRPVTNGATLSSEDIASIKFAYGDCSMPDNAPVRITANYDSSKPLEVESSIDISQPLVWLGAAGGNPYTFEGEVYKFAIDAATPSAALWELNPHPVSGGRAALLRFRSKPAAGTYTLTVSAGSALDPSLARGTVQLTIVVAEPPVCNGVRGDGGCSGHGKCIGGDTPWPCECANGFAGGACSVSTSCGGKGGDLQVGSTRHRLITSHPGAPGGDGGAVQVEAWWGSKGATKGTALRIKGATGDPKGGMYGGFHRTGRIMRVDAASFPTDVAVKAMRGLRWACAPTSTSVDSMACGVMVSNATAVHFDTSLTVVGVRDTAVTYAVVVNGVTLDARVTITTPAGSFEPVIITGLYQIEIEPNGRYGTYLYLDSIVSDKVAGAKAEWSKKLPNRYGPLARPRWLGEFSQGTEVALLHAGPSGSSSSLFSDVVVGCASQTPMDKAPPRA